ncbi:hypothetical protein [Streptomyces hirsutus]|uniref:hypothetical protein n=1 Tax=Streptomyces hirsutus TaxID=35620 RepID=UPI003690182C
MPDVWNGQPLPERRPINRPLAGEIHYRLYDQRTGRLLSFNSTNSLASLVADIATTAREHPDARINAVQYDGPA